MSSEMSEMSLEVKCFSALLRLCGWRCLPVHAMQAEMRELEGRDRAGKVMPKRRSGPLSERQRDAPVVDSGRVAAPTGKVHVNQPPPLEQKPQGFSLSKFQAMIAERCSHIAPAKNSLTLSQSDDETVLFSCLSDERFEDEDLEYLSSLFRSRDGGRMQETVLPIARLLWAKDVEKAKNLLTLALDGLIGLTEEAWYLLQQRHPGTRSGLAKPDVSRLSNLSWGSPSSLRKKALASSCSTASGTSTWYSSSDPTSPVSSSSKCKDKLKLTYLNDPENCSQGSSSTRVSMSRTTFSSSPGYTFSSSPGARSSMSMTGKDRLLPVQVIDKDEPKNGFSTPVHDRLVKVVDIGEDEPWFASLNAYSAPWVPKSCDRRLEWELQFMLTGVLDEVFHSLSRDTSNAAVGSATLLLEKARADVLEWTVKRWNSGRC